MNDDLVERLSTEAKIWPRSDISGLLRESVTEIERLRAEKFELEQRLQVQIDLNTRLREQNSVLQGRLESAFNAGPRGR